MSLEYILSPDQWYSAIITQYPNHQYLTNFVELINADQQAYLMGSNFHAFICGISSRAEEEQQLSSKIIHEFILRLINCGKNNEIWVKLDDQLARFGIQEFCLITGLPCHEVSMQLHFNNDRLRNQYFNGTKRIKMTVISEAFSQCEDKNDKFKLELAIFVECVLKPTGRYIDHKTLSMVEDIDAFLAYPWGRQAYNVLLKSLQASHLERVQRMQQNQQVESKYTLHGYPLAFQYWIYEAFPRVERKFGRPRNRAIRTPRMDRWRPNQIVTENTIRQFLSTQEIRAKSILQPTHEELQTVWYANLSLLQDNHHQTLDGIVAGELNTILEQIHQPCTVQPPADTSFPTASSSTPPISNYVTREEIEQMLNTQRQHIMSDMFSLCNDIRTTMHKLETAIVEQSNDKIANSKQFLNANNNSSINIKSGNKNITNKCDLDYAQRTAQVTKSSLTIKPNFFTNNNGKKASSKTYVLLCKILLITSSVQSKLTLMNKTTIF